MHRTFAFSLVLATLFGICGCKNQAPAPEQQGIVSEYVGDLKEDSMAATLPSAEREPSLQAAQKVLDRLFKAGGDFRRPPPRLSLSNTTDFLAAFRPRSNTIVLEKKALEIARAFGADSLEVLAFLLGHELTHFYQNEGNSAGAISNFLAFGMNSGADINSEKQADLEGVFLAFVADFKKIDMLMPSIVDHIYEAYRLKNRKLSSYPSFLERQQTADEVRQRADSLFHVYEAATYFAGLGQYRVALAAYQYLEKVFVGYELYNNMGIMFAAQALDTGGKRIDTLFYPFETDMTPRLVKARADRLTAAEKARRDASLQQAETCFNKALSLYPQYTAARVNLCCVKILQERPEKALAMLHQINDASEGNAIKLLLTALARQAQGQLETVGDLFRQASVSGSGIVGRIAALDAKILEGRFPEPYACAWSPGPNLPDNLKPRDLRMSGGIFLGGGAILNWLETPHSIVYVCRWPGQSCAVQIIHSAAVSGAPEGISVGQPLRNKNQGWLPMSISRNSTFWKSDDCPVLLLENTQNYIEKWAVLLPL